MAKPGFVSTRGRLGKLGVRPGLRVAVENLDDDAFLAELAEEGVVLSQGEGDLDVLVYGADSLAELAAVADLEPRLAAGGALWIVSLKGKARRVGETEVMAAGAAAGLVDVKVCAFSDTRTALKFLRRR